MAGFDALVDFAAFASDLDLVSVVFVADLEDADLVGKVELLFAGSGLLVIWGLLATSLLLLRTGLALSLGEGLALRTAPLRGLDLAGLMGGKVAFDCGWVVLLTWVL